MAVDRYALRDLIKDNLDTELGVLANADLDEGRLRISRAVAYAVADGVDAASGDSNLYLRVNDTRAVATAPTDYDQQLKAHLKQSSVMGLTGHSYNTIVGIGGWSDDSGGARYELAFGGEGNTIRFRSGTEAGGWSPWRKLLHDGDTGNFALLTGAMFTGDINAQDYNKRLRGFTIIPGGHPENDPINFRFDQDMLRYLTRGAYSGVTITAPDFSAGDLDVLFSALASFANLSGKPDGCSIEVTGLPNLGGSSNGNLYPFVHMHSTSSALRVKMELLKQSAPTDWVVMYDGDVAGAYYMAKVTTTNGYLIGARWTFYNKAAPGSPFSTNVYIRTIGVVGRNTVPYVWNVVKSGDTMYGDLNFATGYAPKVSGSAVFHPGNLRFVDDEVPAGTIDSTDGSNGNGAFTLANTPTAGSLKVYLNGVKMKPTTHYTLSSKTITFVAGMKPTAGSTISCEYRF